MCLAESLLRIPDNQTCDEIIEENWWKEMASPLQ